MKLSVSGVKKTFNGLCGPAQFYLVISLISLVIYLINMVEHRNQMNTASGLTIQAVLVIIWTIILNWVCSLKYGTKVAWFLVFLPMIMVLMALILFYHMVDTMDLTKEDIHSIADKLEKEQCEDCKHK
tara:strand:+ start:227 stop:610 length:384 start_codon:yes stop_codon:yes gene_type:complete